MRHPICGFTASASLKPLIVPQDTRLTARYKTARFKAARLQNGLSRDHQRLQTAPGIMSAQARKCRIPTGAAVISSWGRRAVSSVCRQQSCRERGWDSNQRSVRYVVVSAGAPSTGRRPALFSAHILAPYANNSRVNASFAQCLSTA